ncbi:cysteine dioxygenase family protein [Pseudonocardia acaciae]|uniref:cysteine dioxygenase family protein n=1 Tax=Pseudonocardia acaciae TaxID=551276 RepID=UPI000491EEC3|nr:cysteine dioxygenase family protein [Pseudonocardia acaciae]
MSTHTFEVTELTPLIAPVRAAVRRGLSPADTADVVAARLSGYLTEGRPLPERYRRASPDHYVQHLIHVEDDGSFSVVALVWLPGQCTPIHDHRAWCVAGVAEGQEHEQRYELRTDPLATPHLVPTAEVTNHPGDVSALAPPGDIHRVANSSDALTISLHIYGADIAALGSSVRRVYDNPVTRA